MEIAPVCTTRASSHSSSIGTPTLEAMENLCTKLNTDSSSRPTGVVRARRPFKYLKHEGPRPNAASALSSIDSSAQRRPSAGGSQRYNLTGAMGSSGTGRLNEKPYLPPPSRLLRSRNLNLSALDISACKSKAPKVEVLRDEAESCLRSSGSRRSVTPLTARLSARISQSRFSCFSDWSTSTSPARRVSYSLIGSAVTSYNSHPLSPRESVSSVLPNEPRPSVKRRSETFTRISHASEIGSEVNKKVYKIPYGMTEVQVVDENCYLKSLLLT